MRTLLHHLGIALVAVLFPLSSLTAQAQDTWEPLATGTTQDLHGAYFLSEDTGYVVGAGIVLKTTDGGATWTDVSPEVTQDFRSVHFFDENTGVVGGTNGTILRTEDGGTTWTTAPSGTSDTIFCLSFAGDTGLGGAGGQTILRSTDQGVTWTQVQGGFFGGGFFGAHMLDETSGMLIGQNSISQPLAAYTSDGGDTFDFTAFYLVEEGVGNEGLHRDVHLISDQVAVAVGRTFDFIGGISRTDDGGETWTSELFDPTAGADELMGVDFAEATGYAVGRGGALLKTSDGGQTWTAVSSGVTQDLHGVDLVSATLGYVVGSGGVVLKGALMVDVAAEEAMQAGRLVLHGAYPNPSAGSTKLSFVLPEAGPVRLTVYDLLGRRVATLVDGARQAGEHEVRFDARGLGGGTYLFRLEAGGAQRTERITVIR